MSCHIVNFVFTLTQYIQNLQYDIPILALQMESRGNINNWD